MTAATRPRLRGYLALLGLWSLGWTGYVMARYYRLWAATQIEAPGMAKHILWGIAGGVLVAALACRSTTCSTSSTSTRKSPKR